MTTTIERSPWTSFPSGTLPCASCGVAVSANSETEVEVLQVFGRTRHEGYAPPRHDLHVTRCDECRLIRHSAVDLLGAHPAVRQRIGAAEIAVHRLESALCALDALGTTDAKTIDLLTTTGADLLRLMDALTAPGVHARWAALVRDADFANAPSTPASRARWSHISPEQRRELGTRQRGSWRAASRSPWTCSASTTTAARRDACSAASAQSRHSEMTRRAFGRSCPRTPRA